MHPNNNLDSLRTADYDFLYQSPQQQQPPQQDAFGNANIAGDLDMFANAQFFDFDMNEMPENSPIFAEDTYGVSDGSGTGDQAHGDVVNGNFNYNNYQRYSNNHTKIDGHLPGSLYTEHNNAGATSGKDVSHNSRNDMSSNDSSPTATEIPYPLSSTTTSPTYDSNKSSSKDSAQALVQHLKDNPEEAARVAAEEDKRRRNTAASARFRIKKKQREQALEKSAKEMSDRVSELEAKVFQLEMENKILKDLITEKSGKEVDMDEVKRKVNEASPEASSPKPSTEVRREKPAKEVKVEKASPR